MQYICGTERLAKAIVLQENEKKMTCCRDSSCKIAPALRTKTSCRAVSGVARASHVQDDIGRGTTIAPRPVPEDTTVPRAISSDPGAGITHKPGKP